MRFPKLELNNIIIDRKPIMKEYYRMKILIENHTLLAKKKKSQQILEFIQSTIMKYVQNSFTLSLFIHT